jgi:uncharacterized protein (TIRG00374 family)
VKKKLVLGSIVSAIFLFLALRDIQWGVLWDVLKQTQTIYLVPAVCFTMAGHYSRSYRWKFLLLPVKDIPTWNLFAATAIGFMANNLLPARLGELVRAYVLGKQEQISRTASFATIVYERIIDVFSLLILLWVTLAKVSGPEWMRTSMLWILVLNVAAFVLMLLMVRSPGTVRRLVTRLTRSFPDEFRAKALRVTDGYLGGLAGMTQVKTLLPIALTSLGVWVFAMLGLYYCFLALDMQVPLMANVTLIVLVAMGSMIPSAPAYLGTTQYACIVGLSLYGVGKSEALAFSLLYHATQFFPITLFGLYLLWKAQIRFGEISKG